VNPGGIPLPLQKNFTLKLVRRGSTQPSDPILIYIIINRKRKTVAVVIIFVTVTETESGRDAYNTITIEQQVELQVDM